MKTYTMCKHRMLNL